MNGKIAFEHFKCRLTLQDTVLCLLALSAWIVFHPYKGIWHDGVLYAGQALLHIDPEQFKSDLFFTFGSQDKYTIFSPFYALVIQWVGLYKASFILMLISQTLWFLSAALFSHCLFKSWVKWLALLLLAVLPGYYEPSGVFAYAEVFVTARVFAEALSLLSLVFFIYNNIFISSTLLLVAAMLHPIMALPAIITAIAYYFPLRITGYLIFSGVLIILSVLIFPFPWQALAPMDTLWYQISISRSPFIFLSQWGIEGGVSIIYWMSILVLAAVISPERKLRGFWWAVLFSGFVGFSLAIVASIWPITLLVQMQTWRCAWLLKVAGVFAIVYVIQILWQGRKQDHLMLAMLVAGYFTFNEKIAIALLLVAAFYRTKFYNSLVFSHYVSRYYKITLSMFFLTCIPTIYIELKHIVLNIFSIASKVIDNHYIPAFIFNELSHELVLFIGFVYFSVVYFFWNNKRVKMMLIVFCVIFITIASFGWAFSKPVFNENIVIPGELHDVIKKGAVVYIDINEKLPFVWFHLKRASYISRHQMAGVVFSRQKAIEALRRAQKALPFNAFLLENVYGFNTKSSRLAKNLIVTDQSLVNLCQDTNLDYVILTQSLEGELGIEPVYFFSSNIYRADSQVQLKLYECQRLIGRYHL